MRRLSTSLSHAVAIITVDTEYNIRIDPSYVEVVLYVRLDIYSGSSQGEGLPAEASSHSHSSVMLTFIQFGSRLFYAVERTF